MDDEPERFTIGYGPDGQPIQLAVQDMTPIQLGAAMAWQRVEADRLKLVGSARHLQAATARAARLLKAVHALLSPEAPAKLH